ncbi:30S ribosomal protein S13 [Patescibacteria group bacterium]
MARIVGVELPPEKRIEIGLTSIHGIGRSLSNKILSEIKLDPNKRVKEITEDEIQRLREVIEKNHTVEGDLRREITMNIRRLKEIGSYRGSRHKKKLPARGQRTKTNARTKRGRRITVGSGRKPASEKT